MMSKDVLISQIIQIRDIINHALLHWAKYIELIRRLDVFAYTRENVLMTEKWAIMWK